MHRPLSAALTALALVAFASPALAASPAGTWRSTTGASVVVTPEVDGAFDVLLTAAGGQRSLFAARWIAGLEGTQFRYWVHDGTTRLATFNDRGQLHVAGGTDAPAIWTLQARPAYSPAAGLWRSTSGNRFRIVPGADPDGPFDVLLIAPSGGRTAYQARWVAGLEGVQFTYGDQTATFNPLRGDFIRLVSGTTWTLVEAPEVADSGWRSDRPERGERPWRPRRRSP